jgi:hypothetical protein
VAQPHPEIVVVVGDEAALLVVEDRVDDEVYGQPGLD